MARAPRRAVRPGLYQDRQGIRHHGADEHRCLYRSHFGVVRKAAGGVHLFRHGSAGPDGVARGNRRRDGGHRHRKSGVFRKLIKSKSESTRSGKPKTASRPQPPMVSWRSLAITPFRVGMHSTIQVMTTAWQLISWIKKVDFPPKSGHQDQAAPRGTPHYIREKSADQVKTRFR